MSEIQIKQIEGKLGYHVFVNGVELKSCVTSIQFPQGIQCGPVTPVVLNVIGNVDIDLQSAKVMVNKNADLHR